jgi:carbon storage regulator
MRTHATRREFGMARANPVAIMFIIARRRGQRIEIGDGIAITVTDISRNLVKLGIEAPRDCLIARGELKESVALANREAALCNMAPADQPVFNGSLCSQVAIAEATSADSFLLASVKTLASIDVSKTTEESTELK